MNIIELSICILPSFNGFLNDFFIVLKIFVHQFSGISIERLFEIFGIDVLKQMQQADDHLVQFVIGFPSFSQYWQANISLFVDIWMEDFVETFHIGLRERVVSRCIVWEGNFWMWINCVLGGYDWYVEFCYFIRVGVGYFNIANLIFLVSQYIFAHALLGRLWSGLLFLLCFFLNSSCLEVF